MYKGFLSAAGIAGSLAVLAAGFGGCEFPHAAAPSRGETSSPTEAGKGKSVYPKLAALQAAYAQKGVEAVEAYIPLAENAARNAGGKPIDLMAVGSLLPDDVSTLKRLKPASSRSAGEWEEITLEEELEALADQFSAQFQADLPDPAKALSLPFVEAGDGGIIIGGDFIPYQSMEGAMTVELLNAIADGADPEAYTENMANEIQTLFQDASADGRALVRVSGTGSGRWPQGRVYCRFGSISPEHRQAVLEAMGDWNAKTGGKVQFEELLPHIWWHRYLLRICVTGIVEISDYGQFPYGTTGETQHVGYTPGSRYLRLKDGLSGNALKNTARHELGHVLGLQHEHQRPDRDRYIIVPQSGRDYDKLPETVTGWESGWMHVKIGWFYIPIPYIRHTTKYLLKTYGGFDYQSIMLYNMCIVKDTPEARAAGLRPGSQVGLNTALSRQDIEAVKQMY
jgi:hypothetical protein